MDHFFIKLFSFILQSVLKKDTTSIEWGLATCKTLGYAVSRKHIAKGSKLTWRINWRRFSKRGMGDIQEKLL